MMGGVQLLVAGERFCQMGPRLMFKMSPTGHVWNVFHFLFFLFHEIFGVHEKIPSKSRNFS